MTPELDKYYSDRFSMMASEGWKELLIDIDNKSYADSIASGVNFHAACQYATTAAGRGGVIIFEAY